MDQRNCDLFGRLPPVSNPMANQAFFKDYLMDASARGQNLYSSHFPQPANYGGQFVPNPGAFNQQAPFEEFHHNNNVLDEILKIEEYRVPFMTAMMNYKPFIEEARSNFMGEGSNAAAPSDMEQTFDQVNNNSYLSPAGGGQNCDPFSPSVSSSVSSIQSVEMLDRTFVPGSVDSGIASGSLSSPFSVAGNQASSSRSVSETTPSSIGSSELCSPPADLDSLTLGENSHRHSTSPRMLSPTMLGLTSPGMGLTSPGMGLTSPCIGLTSPVGCLGLTSPVGLGLSPASFNSPATPFASGCYTSPEVSPMGRKPRPMPGMGGHYNNIVHQQRLQHFKHRKERPMAIPAPQKPRFTDAKEKEAACSQNYDFIPSDGEDNKKGKKASIAVPAAPPAKRQYKSRKRKGEDGAKPKPPPPPKKLKKSVLLKATYQSEISPDQNGRIKMKISLAAPLPPPVPRKRRKHKKKGELEPDKAPSPAVQSPWGNAMPGELLRKIFRYRTHADGCVPFLNTMANVCNLWRQVSVDPILWTNVDLTHRSSKNPNINDGKLKWLCENRLSNCRDLNLTGWKFAQLPNVLEKIRVCCPNLKGLSLCGWEDLNVDHAKFIATNYTSLERVDLTAVSPMGSNNKSGVCSLALTYFAEEMGDRLTHLILAGNRLGGMSQFIAAISKNCPNLEVLDLSNVRTMATTGLIHVELLQEGCPKLRVCRIANSQVALAPIPLKDRVSSPGFPMLEELSVACAANSLSSITQPFVDDESIERILKTSNKLKLLDVRGCTRITVSSLVRVPAWDLTHLFLSGSYVTRTVDSGLELIAQKWSHSLIEVDFAWSTTSKSLDAAVMALAEQGDNSNLRVIDLTGSSVGLAPLKAILSNCSRLHSINLTSCRALPRGIKRSYNHDTLCRLKATCYKTEGDEFNYDDYQL